MNSLHDNRTSGLTGHTAAASKLEPIAMALGQFIEAGGNECSLF